MEARSAVDRRADLQRLVRELRREAVAHGHKPAEVRAWPLERLLGERRRHLLVRFVEALRADLIHLGAPRDQVITWPLERMLTERRRLLADLIERPGRGAGCTS